VLEKDIIFRLLRSMDGYVTHYRRSSICDTFKGEIVLLMSVKWTAKGSDREVGHSVSSWQEDKITFIS
jgi:hypothetical protein